MVNDIEEVHFSLIICAACMKSCIPCIPEGHSIRTNGSEARIFNIAWKI